MQNAEGRMQKFFLIFSAFCILPSAFLACRRETGAQWGGGAPAAAKRKAYDTLPPRDRFIGSEACADCHDKNYNRWQHDWHARALSKATKTTILGPFNHRHFKGEASEAW